MPITDPRDIPGLRVWYSAQAESGYSEGQELTKLTDFSGNSRHGVTQSGGIGHTWSATGGPKGGPSIVFNNGYMIAANVLTGLTQAEYMATVKSDRAPGIGNGCLIWTGGQGSSIHWPYSDNAIYDDFCRSARQDAIVTNPTETSWIRAGAWSALNDWALQINGVTARSSGANTVSVGGGSLQIARNQIGTNFIGRLGGLVIYDHKLTAGQRSDLATWMTNNPSGGLQGVAAPTVVPVTDPRSISGLIAWYSADFEATRYADNAKTLLGLKDLSGNNNDAAYSGTDQCTMKYTGGPGNGKRIQFAGGYFNLPNILTGLTAAEVFSTLITTANGALWLLGERQSWMTWSSPSIVEGFGRSNAQGSISYNFVNQSPYSWCKYNVWAAPSDYAVYLNGENQYASSIHTSAWSTTASSPPINIGRDNTGGPVFSGSMSLFLLYNRKLTFAERTSLNAWIETNQTGGVQSSGGGGGGTGSRLDQTMAALVAKGYTTGSIQDRQAAYLRAKTSLSKSSADMQKADNRVIRDLLLASTVT